MNSACMFITNVSVIVVVVFYVGVARNVKCDAFGISYRKKQNIKNNPKY